MRQVVASLSVSLVLMGFKCHGLKRLVQLSQRRTELKAALALLQSKVEEEALVMFLEDVDHDATQRQTKVGELASPSGRVYSTMENAAVERCLGMFALFESNNEVATQLKHSATITRLESKYDKATGLQFGFATLEIRAAPVEIAAYFLNCDCRFVLSCNAADPNVIRHEVLEYVNAHHTIVFRRQPRPLCSTRCPDPPPTPQRTRKHAPTHPRTRCADTG